MKEIHISSRRNGVIADIKKLKNKKQREATGLFMVEGYRNLVDSLKSGRVKKIVYSDSFCENKDFLEKLDCEIYRVTEVVFSDISDTKTPQGILGVFEIPKFDHSRVSDKMICLNAVSDPGNVGTIFRTALAAGFYSVVLDDACADAYSNKVVRSAMSAIFELNILRTNSLPDLIKTYQSQGFVFYTGAFTENPKSLFDVDFNMKTAFVFGSEANGVSKEILDCSDVVYQIPMTDKIESLNVAVAASISLYECVRQQNIPK